MYLEAITGPEDLKRLDRGELPLLAAEVRAALLQKLSRTGGHTGPNLGVVEATIALHYVFDSPQDRIVFDVSHQTYTHKMLTGRSEAFLDPAHYGDVTGFSSPYESEHDVATTGHTSTSVSWACGLATARDMTGGDWNVVAFIGDGSLSGGEAFEGLDLAGSMKNNLIVVVNDNDASIAPNVGGLYGNLAELRATGGRAGRNFFRDLGLDYRFVPDGNDLDALVDAFAEVKGIDHPIVVHIVTRKGNGYGPAERSPEAWHSTGPFDLATGEGGPKAPPELATITARHLVARMASEPDLVAVTAGTPGMFGFTPELRAQAGRQFLDVGIAEQSAVSVTAGLVRGGAKAVYGVMSTFLQRAYDQVAQDLCLDCVPACLAVFGGTLFAPHDATHHGFQDVPMLGNVPNLVYLAPTTVEQYLSALDWGIDQTDYPVAIKVPGGPVRHGAPCEKDWGRLNSFELVQDGRGIALVGLGSMFPVAERAAAIIEKRTGVTPALVNPLYASGVDGALLGELAGRCSVVVTLEDGIVSGGFGDKVARFYGPDRRVAVLCRGLAKQVRERYDVDELLRSVRMTPEQVADDAIAAVTS